MLARVISTDNWIDTHNIPRDRMQYTPIFTLHFSCTPQIIGTGSSANIKSVKTETPSGLLVRGLSRRVELRLTRIEERRELQVLSGYTTSYYGRVPYESERVALKENSH
jgi:hypothetical protein